MTKRRLGRYGALPIILALTGLLAVALWASAQTVLVRARIGNNIEGGAPLTPKSGTNPELPLETYRQRIRILRAP